MGLPLFTSSFEVILHCEPTFHGSGHSGLSPIGLKQLCTLFHVHIVKPMNPNYQCFSPFACLLTYFCKECFLAQHFFPFQGCYFFVFSSCSARPSFSLQSFLFCWVMWTLQIRDLYCCISHKAKEQCQCSMPQCLCPSRVNWVRSSKELLVCVRAAAVKWPAVRWPDLLFALRGPRGIASTRGELVQKS